MNKIPTSLEDVFVLEPKVFGDARGFFLESYNQRVMAELGIRANFVQDNHSYSTRNVVQGLHYQVEQPQEADSGDRGRDTGHRCRFA
jgi:dTDP-4-dehydrorhamnose 3,5-epimerase